jgi:SAM-dependent methyltransferase
MGLVEHFKTYAKAVVEDEKIPQGSLAVELGSNDGSLLKAFKALGMRVVGVDPARSIAAAATAEGIPTLPEFFSADIAAGIRADSGPASVVCANNVFAHIDDMSDLVKGIRTLLADDGIFVFEASYVPDMIDGMVFDTIYHEHVSHHTLRPLERFFGRFDMTLFDVKRVATKGGSIRGFAQVKSTGRRPQSPQLLQMLAEEERRELGKPEIYRAFYRRIEERRVQNLAYIDQCVAAGQKVAAYGAATTATTLLFHFELGSRLSFVVDDNPIKHGLYSPVLHLPVHPSSALYTEKPGLVVILAWTYATPIIKRHAAYLQAGGKFLVPLPEMRVVEKPLA